MPSLSERCGSNVTIIRDGEGQGMKTVIISVIKNLRMFRRSPKTLIPLLDLGKYS